MPPLGDTHIYLTDDIEQYVIRIRHSKQKQQKLACEAVYVAYEQELALSGEFCRRSLVSALMR